jgi:hypothetical protein
VTADDGDFLAGFLEGEACFSVVRQSGRANHGCVMRVSVRDDDSSLIAELAQATRLGTIAGRPARASSRPQVMWSIGSKADCLRLIRILYRHPLRGKKGRDFALWAAAVRWWAGSDPTRRSVHRDWAPMVYIKQRLHENRSYDPDPPPLLDPRPGLTRDWLAFLSGLRTLSVVSRTVPPKVPASPLEDMSSPGDGAPQGST